MTIREHVKGQMTKAFLLLKQQETFIADHVKHWNTLSWNREFCLEYLEGHAIPGVSSQADGEDDERYLDYLQEMCEGSLPERHVKDWYIIDEKALMPLKDAHEIVLQFDDCYWWGVTEELDDAIERIDGS